MVALRRMHDLGRELRWQQARSMLPLDSVIAPLPEPPVSREWFFDTAQEAKVAVTGHAVLVELPPSPHATSALSLASTMKKRVTKMNKHKRRKRRKRDRLKKRQN